MQKSAVSGRVLLLAAGLSLLGATAQAKPHHAAPKPDPRDAQIAAMQAQIETLANKVEQLEARASAQPPIAPAPPPPVLAQAAPPPAPPGPPAPAQYPAAGGATIIAGKPQISSADGRFAANFHGVMQFDAAAYDQGKAGPTSSDFRRGAAAGDTAHARDLSNGTNFRRARIGVDGKAFGDFEYNLLFEFGGAGEEDAGHIQELWFQYSGLKPFHARIGAFPPSIGLEDQASTNGALFLERPAIADISRSLAGGDFREAAMLWAAGDRWYAAGSVTGRTVGVVNSQATGVAQPYDSALGLIGRAVFIPVKDDDVQWQVGVHGSYVARTADVGGPDGVASSRYTVTFQERPELRVDGTRLISTGAINAAHASTLGLETAFQYKNLFIQGEYERLAMERRGAATGVSNPDFHGFYVEGGWVVTGEKRRFNPGTFAYDAPPVDHPFNPANGTWGAFEIAGRYSDTDLNYHEGAAGAAPLVDSVRGGEQKIAAIGLNWFPNTFVRFMLDYQDVRIDRLSPSGATYLTPAGAEIGQHYNAVSLRSQFAF